MSNAFIAYTNLVDTAPLITATTSALLLPVSNIVVPHIARKWRGASAIGTDGLVIDLGSPVSFDTIAVMGITADQIQFRASNVDASGIVGELLNTGAVSVDQKYLSSIELLSSPISARYVRIDLIGSPFVEVGRVFIGSRTQFAYNYVAGWQRAWVDPSTRTKTLSGQTLIFPRQTYRTYDVSFDFLKEADRDGFIEDIDSINAMKTDVLFCNNPASDNLSRDTVWGLMSALTPVVQPYTGIYTKEYQIEERL